MQAKITLPFYEADKLNIPLVVGSFTIADGRQVQCLFIIDTGSRDNVLNAKAVKYLAIENLLDEKYAVTSLEGKGEECAVANVDFELGGEEFHESFSICQSLDFQEVLGLYGILGILGSRFLSKRGLALDCGARCPAWRQIPSSSVRRLPLQEDCSRSSNIAISAAITFQAARSIKVLVWDATREPLYITMANIGSSIRRVSLML